MASPVRNILAASALAALLAVLMAAPTIGGISSWKVVLAALGVILFVLGYDRSAQNK